VALCLSKSCYLTAHWVWNIIVVVHNGASNYFGRIIHSRSNWSLEVLDFTQKPRISHGRHGFNYLKMWENMMKASYMHRETLKLWQSTQFNIVDEICVITQEIIWNLKYATCFSLFLIKCEDYNCWKLVNSHVFILIQPAWITSSYIIGVTY
jgi:hypothetical protein